MARKSKFVCPACGYEDNAPILCPDCVQELEEMCSTCGNAVGECTCEELEKDELIAKEEPAE